MPPGVANPNAQKKPNLRRVFRGSALEEAVDEAAVEEVAEKEVKEEDTALSGLGMQLPHLPLQRTDHTAVSLGRHPMQPELLALVPEASDLCLTPTTQEHVDTILEAYSDNRPLLAESATGVDTGALVAFCAHQTRSPLKRVAMSSSLTVGDLLGKATFPGKDQNAEDGTPLGLFGFGLGLFAYTFYFGCRVFLDGVALASDAILQVCACVCLCVRARV